MGQRLVLAITLLIVARTVTFISPLPAEPDAGIDRRGPSQLFQPPSPSTDRPTDRSFSESVPVEEAESPAGSQAWQTPPAPSPLPTPSYQARANQGSPSAACQSVHNAVVTVIPGKGAGSGSIVSPDGLVITNNHVIKRLGDRTLYVKTSNGSRYVGQIIATDQRNDLALIRMNAQNSFPIVRFSTERNPEIGQAVCAIGSPYGQPGVITEGILRRVLRNGDLQSDLVLKPGNSGGPLLNTQAEMIGVNKRIIRDEQGGVRASFSTNGAIAKDFVEQNRNNSPIQGSAQR
ncbi:MAG: trypsin-like peptidase domain-containing protein [Leptolyngbyaceae cyanobacterium bins.302]|nr:trypsin-like peptidase domain-containing protein [Leptolyngbyaceae cyanobacterium bins.302]